MFSPGWSRRDLRESCTDFRDGFSKGFILKITPESRVDLGDNESRDKVKAKLKVAQTTTSRKQIISKNNTAKELLERCRGKVYIFLIWNIRVVK